MPKMGRCQGFTLGLTTDYKLGARGARGVELVGPLVVYLNANMDSYKYTINHIYIVMGDINQLYSFRLGAPHCMWFLRMLL